MGVSPARPDTPAESFVLSNGLTVVVNEDHHVPLVHVRMRYQVGKRDGPYAHLLEHLMFGPTQHHPRPLAEAAKEIGVVLADAITDLDGTTYLTTVPPEALDAVLWLESQRIGYPCLTREHLETEVEIIRNERRLHAGQPGRQILVATLAEAYPGDHPYAFVEETDEDLDAVTLAIVEGWHRRYYHPANAVLVVAGAVQLDDVRAKVERYFGALSPGVPRSGINCWIGRHSADLRRHTVADVAERRLRLVWNMPGWGTAAADHLRLVAATLAGSEATPLVWRLVHGDRFATRVSGQVHPFELGGLFTLDVMARRGVDLRQVEAAVREEVEQYITAGPVERALHDAKRTDRMRLARDVERLGLWAAGRAHLLMQGQVVWGAPGHYRRMQARAEQAEPDDLRQAARVWLSEGALVLEIHPRHEASMAATVVPGASRAAARLRVAWPPGEVSLSHAGTKPAGGANSGRTYPTTRPAVRERADPPSVEAERFVLTNGLQVVLAPRSGTELVHLELVLGAGYATGTPGMARLALAMLGSGTRCGSSMGFANGLRALGGTMATSGCLDASFLQLVVLREQVAAALQLLADAVQRPGFSAPALDQARRQQLSEIRREEHEPQKLALHLMPRLLYGPHHPYGRSLAGTGSEPILKRTKLEDVIAFYDRHVHPSQTVLILAGGFDAGVARRWVEEAFAGWTASSAITRPTLWAPSPAGPVLFLLDRPGAHQTDLFAAQRAAVAYGPDRVAYEVMRRILGGFDVNSRLMRNLRTARGWSYRISFLNEELPAVRGPEPLLLHAAVQPDRAGATLREIISEWAAIQEARPVTADELGQAVRAMKTQALADLETLASRSAHLRYSTVLDLPPTYLSNRFHTLSTLTPDDVTQVARTVLDPACLAWLVVGDRAKLEAELRALDLGPVHVLTREQLPAVVEITASAECGGGLEPGRDAEAGPVAADVLTSYHPLEATC